jgi:hypothetical protein
VAPLSNEIAWTTAFEIFHQMELLSFPVDKISFFPKIVKAIVDVVSEISGGTIQTYILGG